MVVLTEHSNCRIQFLLWDAVSTGENNRTGSFNLVVIELTKVLHIDLYLAGIYHSNGTIQHDILIGDLFNGSHHIGQLAHAGGFNDNSIRVIICNYLIQRLSKVTYQTTADATGIHFGNIDTCILQKATVYADFAKLIFNENQFLACITFCNHFFDQCCFSCSQEAGVYINFSHLTSRFPIV